MVSKSGSTSTSVDGDDDDQHQRRHRTQIATLRHRLHFCATMTRSPTTSSPLHRPRRVEDAAQRPSSRRRRQQHRANNRPDTRPLALRHEDPPRNRPGKLHSLPGDALESGVKTNAACVANADKLSMGADNQDYPTGSTVTTGMGAGGMCPCHPVL